MRNLVGSIVLCGCVGSGASSPDGSVAGGPDTGRNVSDASAASGRDAYHEVVLGGPGCGLPNAAFCDTFDAPSSHPGRAGELDSRYWSAGRLAPQLPSGNGVALGVPVADVPACRADVPGTVEADRQSLVCDANAAIPTAHLMVAASAQNYGQTSLRIRQPFDFGGRTGRITFDAEGVAVPLLGWISVEVTEDPINAPSFEANPEANNDEGSLLPRRAIEVQFQSSCSLGGSGETGTALRGVMVYDDYQLTFLEPSGTPCLRVAEDHLNHFEVELSQSHITVYASDYSEDGVTFAPKQVVFDGDISLPFSRGYVQITTHNHATLKYSNNGELNAWVARWDNVGFDGPVVSAWREYEVADAHEPGQGAWNLGDAPVISIAYRIPDSASAEPLSFQFQEVDPSGMTSAVLSASIWYLNQGEVATYGLRYRLNGGAWHERPLTSAEQALLNSPLQQGQLGQTIELPIEELRAGENTLELFAVNVPQNYPPIAANIDLVLRD
jgi:hypothetical protein